MIWCRSHKIVKTGAWPRLSAQMIVWEKEKEEKSDKFWKWRMKLEKISKISGLSINKIKEIQDTI